MQRRLLLRRRLLHGVLLMLLAFHLLSSLLLLRLLSLQLFLQGRNEVYLSPVFASLPVQICKWPPLLRGTRTDISF